MKKRRLNALLFAVIGIATAILIYIITSFSSYLEGVVIIVPEKSKGDFKVVFGCQQSNKSLQIQDNLGIVFLDKANKSVEISDIIDSNIGVIIAEMDYNEIESFDFGSNVVDIKSRVSNYSFSSQKDSTDCGSIVLSFEID